MMNQIKQMMNMIKTSSNPQMALNQLMQSNPQMKQVMDLVNTSGNSPEQLFYALAKQKGINPNEILDALK